MPSLPPACRRAILASLVAVATPALTGCLSIKAHTVSQRAPGVVELGGIVCASDYDLTHGSRCRRSNVAEPDELRIDADQSGQGQLLVGFRVPDGTGAPATFASDLEDVTFSRSETYMQALATRFLPPAGQHWEGYVSTVKSFEPGVAADATTSVHPEFTLPPQPAGAPFSGPLPWRMVVGFRRLPDVGGAGAPVVCTAPALCVDAPEVERVPTALQAPVSDFGVLPGTGATAPQTTTATVSFPLSYSDGGNLGARDVALAATTDVPGATATPSATSVQLAPGTTSIDVSVPVALGTPPGTYSVQLSASTGLPAVTRSGKATITVAGPPDGDADGIADPSDRCPGVARGRFDADADGCVGPYARIAATTSGTWAVGAKGVRIGRMRLKGVPAGARVALRGRVRQTLTAGAARVDFKRLRGKLIKRGKGFTATVTGPGLVGQRLTLRVKRFGTGDRELERIARRPFKTTRRCIPVGAPVPAATCTATPPTGP